MRFIMKKIINSKFFKIISIYIVILGLLAILLGTFCLNGSKKIFNDIEKITAVPHRELEIIKDKENLGLVNDNSGQDFKILQLSDIHLSCSYATYENDLSAIKAVEKVVRNTAPDLIVLTGDIIYPSILHLNCNNDLIAKAIIQLMENLSIPWSVTYGNHDTESYSTCTRDQISTLYENAPSCLFYRGSENIYGSGNYLVKLYNYDRTLNQVLVMMDSNSYVPNSFINDYDNIHEDQIEWYSNTLNKICEEEKRIVPSILYIHIPFKEYKIAWDMYLAGSSEVTYIDGGALEGFSAPKREDSMFETIERIQSTKAVFCGHDHLNTYAISYKNVILSYGMSIDYLAYPTIYHKTSQRGGTLVSISPDGTFSFERIYLKDL